MTREHENAMRLLIALQVGILEHNDERIGDPSQAMPAIEQRLKELTQAVKAIKKRYE